LRQARVRLVSAQRRADASLAARSLTTYSGEGFDVDYPRGWTVSTSASAAFDDTTIRSPDRARLIRVDVQQNAPSSDPGELAAPVEKVLEPQPGYRLLGWSPTTFAGYDALRWEFLVAEHGVLLRKVDTFFVDNSGRGIAILVQAPAAGYQYWGPVFAQVRDSLVVDDFASEPEEASPAETYDSSTPAPLDETGFCDTHACIDNFDNGNGYIVQCADGMWSHSGGIQGACSWHGGETDNGYDGADNGYDSYHPTPAPSGGVDLGPGNGYTVTCADGSISHSGGIQGACSHHGGVGP
jgi:hypothetical protein